MYIYFFLTGKIGVVGFRGREILFTVASDFLRM